MISPDRESGSPQFVGRDTAAMSRRGSLEACRAVAHVRVRNGAVVHVSAAASAESGCDIDDRAATPDLEHVPVIVRG